MNKSWVALLLAGCTTVAPWGQPLSTTTVREDGVEIVLDTTTARAASIAIEAGPYDGVQAVLFEDANRDGEHNPTENSRPIALERDGKRLVCRDLGLTEAELQGLETKNLTLQVVVMRSGGQSIKASRALENP